MNKEIAQAEHTERFVFQVFFVMCAVLGALFLLGWGIPWLSEQKTIPFVRNGRNPEQFVHPST